MQRPDDNIQPIYLTEDEAFALLEMCLTSATTTRSEAEDVMHKVSDLVRWFISNQLVSEFAGTECCEAAVR